MQQAVFRSPVTLYGVPSPYSSSSNPAANFVKNRSPRQPVDPARQTDGARRCASPHAVRGFCWTLRFVQPRRVGVEANCGRCSPLTRVPPPSELNSGCRTMSSRDWKEQIHSTMQIGGRGMPQRQKSIALFDKYLLERGSIRCSLRLISFTVLTARFPFKASFGLIPCLSTLPYLGVRGIPHR